MGNAILKYLPYEMLNVQLLSRFCTPHTPYFSFAGARKPFKPHKQTKGGGGKKNNTDKVLLSLRTKSLGIDKKKCTYFHN